MKKTGLGKGIGALFELNNTSEDEVKKTIEGISSNNNSSNEENKYIREIKLIDIVPNDLQARKVFDKQKLEELATSIKMFGVIQPIIVSKEKDYYVIVAGERRWRAAKIAGLKTIPAIISKETEKNKDGISLIENLQREGLNPVEKARGIALILEKYNLTGSELAEITGISLSSILNSIKILKIEKDLLDTMQNIKNLSESTCLALLETDNYDIRKEALLLMTEEGLPATEAIKRLKLLKRKRTYSPRKMEPIFKEFENSFGEYFGAKVQIKLNNNKSEKGKIIIKYDSNEDLARMLDLLK